MGLGIATAQAATPIDTGAPFYLQSNVGVTVNPDFRGGTLRDNVNAVTDTHAYNVENFPTNTIDEFGNTVTFTGTFSGAGPLTLADSVGGGNAIFTGADIVGGAVTINNGATLTWGNGTGGAFLIGPGNAVVDNGALVMDFGGGASVVGAIPISGTGTLEVHTGILTEEGPATYTGGTTIDAGGVLQLASTGGSNGTVVGNIADNGLLQFDYTGGSPVTSANNISGTGSAEAQAGTTILTGISLISGTVTIDSGATMQWGNGAGAALLAGGGDAVTDNGALVIAFGGGGLIGPVAFSGTGTVEIQSGFLSTSGTSTLTGTTTIDSGATLQLGTGGATGSMAGAIVDNGTLKFEYSGPVTVGNAISGSGNAEVIAGTAVITGIDILGGSVTIDSGATMQWGNGTGGAFLIGPGNAVTDNGALVIDFGGGSSVVGDIPISGTGTVEIKTGILTEEGPATYTGGTTIDAAGVLQLASTGGSNGTVVGNIADNGLLQFDYSGPVVVANQISGTGSAEAQAGTAILTALSLISGTVTIDSGATMQWGNGAGPALLAGGGDAVTDNGALVIAFGSGGLIGPVAFSGTGTVEIQSGFLSTSATSTYSGTTTIDAAGTLALTGGGSISNSGGVIDNGVFDISGTTAGTSITSLEGSGGVSLGAKTLTLTNASGVFSGVLSDGGSGGGVGGGLTIALGTETLSGTNTFTGNTTIKPGATLVLGAGGTTGSVAGNIVDNGLVQFNYSGPVTTPGNFSGSGSAEVVAGTAVFTGFGFLGGTVTIDSGATMQWGDGSGGVGLLVGAGDAVADNGALVLDFGGGGLGATIPISGTGSFELVSGSLNNAGVSTYTGTTTIDAGGFLLLNGAGSIANSSDVIINGQFDIGSTAGISIKSLAGSGHVALGAQTLTLTNASGVFSGVLADGSLFAGGTGAKLTIAAGTETLTGTNTFTGATTITGGATLQLGNGGATGSVAGPIVDNGSLLFNYSGPVTTSGNISGSGKAEVVAGTAVITGFGFLGGTVTIDSGATMQWGDGSGGVGLLEGGGGTVADNGALVLNFGGGGLGATIAISGTGSFELVSGSLNNAGVSTYTGATTIDAGGFLLLNGAGSIANSSDVIVNGAFDIGSTAGISITTLEGSGHVALGAQTLTLTNASGVFSGALTDGSLFAGGTGAALTIAAGTETLTGTNTFTGATTINPGATLQLGAEGTTGSVAGNIVDNGLVRFNYAGSVISDNAFSGSGAVEVVAGTVVETGFGGVSGNVTIDPGATLQWGNAGVGVLSGANIVDNGAFVIDFGGSGLGSGIPVIGTGSLEIKSGSASFSAANTYTGTTTIDSGALFALNGAGSISNSSLVTDNGTFDISGTAAGTSITTLAGTGGVSLGAQTLTITNASGTLGGVLADGGLGGGTGGGLTIGGGTQTLTGTNTFTGATTINSGATLQLGAGGTTGTVAGNITDNGILKFDYSGPVTIGGNISGSGNAEIVAGTLIATGLSGVGGTVTIDNGATLQWGNGAPAILRGAAGLVDNGAFVVDFGAGGIGTATAISGPGTVTIQSGSLNDSAVSTYTGTTTINSGGIFALSGPGSISNSSLVTDNGTFDISGTTAGTSIVTLSGSGLVSLGSKTLTLTNAFGVFSGVLADGGIAGGTGGSLTIAGGTETLDGVNTYTGTTTIGTGATLVVGDAAHPGAAIDSHVGGVIVDAGATLEGHGTIAGAVSNTSGGTVSPGGTIGTLTVGSYTQGANSTLDIEVSPAAASQLNSLGAASLNGTLHLIFDPGFYTTHVYDIVNGSPVTGTFSSVTSTSSPGVVFGLLYTPTQVDLLLVSTATAQPFGGISTATLGRAHGIASLVEDRMRDLRCTGRPDEQSQSCEGTEIWAQGFGATDGLDNQGSRLGYSNNAYGFVGGVDEHWSEGSTVGAAFAYESDTLGVSAALSKATGSSYFGAVYGRWVAGQVFLDGEGFYMHSDWSMHRLVPGFGTALSSPSGDTKGLLLQASAPVDDGDLRPYLRGTYAEFDRSSTIETGVGAVGLAVASGSSDLGMAEGGLIWSHAYAMSGGAIRPTLQLGFADSFGGRTPIITAALVGAPGTTFTVASASPAQTGGVVGFSLGWDSGQDFELTSDVRAQVGGGQTQAEFSLGGVYRF